MKKKEIGNISVGSIGQNKRVNQRGGNPASRKATKSSSNGMSKRPTPVQYSKPKSSLTSPAPTKGVNRDHESDASPERKVDFSWFSPPLTPIDLQR